MRQQVWTVPYHELDDIRLRDMNLRLKQLRIKAQRAVDLGEVPQQVDQPWALPTHYLALHLEAIKVCRELQSRNIMCGWFAPPPEYLVQRLDGKVQPADGQRPWPVNSGLIRRDRWKLVCEWNGRFKGRLILPDDVAEWEKAIERYKRYGCSHRAPEGQFVCEVCGRAIRDRKGEWVEA